VAPVGRQGHGAGVKRILTRADVLTAGLSAGQKRLWRFVDAERRRGKHAPADMRQLAAAFQQILDGADPRTALGVGGKQGRRPLTARQAEERHIPAAVEVYQQMKSGVLRDDAIDHVAMKRGEKRSFVEDCYKNYGSTARFLLDVVTTWGKKQP
jgi:hypothetical protein